MNKKGFTLVEVLVALGIVVLMATVSLTTISAVGSARVKKYTETMIAQFDLAREYARTHGGDVKFVIERIGDDVIIRRESNQVLQEEIHSEDKSIHVYYKVTGESEEHELESSSKLTMAFSQTAGSVIGPDLIDSITVSNGSKSYTLLINHDAGKIDYDYNMPADNENQTMSNVLTLVEIPQIKTENGFKNILDLPENGNIEFRVPAESGSTVQPQINYDSEHIRIGGVYRASNVGQYTMTFTLKDPYSTKWDSDDEGVASASSLSVMWEIF